MAQGQKPEAPALVLGLGMRVRRSGFRVADSGFRVQGHNFYRALVGLTLSPMLVSLKHEQASSSALWYVLGLACVG